MFRVMIITSTTILLLLLLARPLPATDSSSFDAVYIVYTGAANPANFAVKETVLNSLLESRRRWKQEMEVLMTYSHGLSGFAARLSPEEAASVYWAIHPRFQPTRRRTQPTSTVQPWSTLAMQAMLLLGTWRILLLILLVYGIIIVP
ncbi:unnamed protein product [Linum tenue]|uniref:Inhibitor I9 domain-containing protein n=1 Tax=Linum tenue TaxID=586396 RepID=A0AAV0L6X6_9ROSI|nr:unnamed protein product [Linum tenue]